MGRETGLNVEVNVRTVVLQGQPVTLTDAN
jgi:hypothetical protein